MDDDPKQLARNAARTLQGRLTAFDATIGAIEASETVAAQPTASALGPRTLDVRALPLIGTSAAAGGADLEVTGRLGEGGMGIVELARQRSLQRDVAIKRLKPGVTDASRVWAMLQEAAFTGFVEHPGIVPVHALGRDEHGLPVMVMKRVEGVTLLTLLRDEAHPAWARANGDRLGMILEVVRRLCEALSAAHARGVVHRDVKPENVMLGPFGEVVLLDWGVAVPAGERLSSIAGTPAYMAPEMLAYETTSLDARTDVYLLGATLHECLTGAPPHWGATLTEVLSSVAESSPRAYGESVPEELAAIVHRAMHRVPGERFADTAALAQALEIFERHRAASELADAAALRLGELEARVAADPDAPDIDALFHACRFGFEQALRGYPDSRTARAGLRRALVAMVGHELRRRNATSAASLLASLDEPGHELSERLETLRRELSAEDADRARLARMEHDLDVSVAARERAIGVRVAGVLVVVATIGITGAHVAGIFTPNAGVMAAATLPGAAVVAAVLFLGRRKFFGNRVNRQMGYTLLTAIGAVMAHRVLGAVRGWSLSDVASGDGFVIATVAAVSALTLRRVFFLPAAFFGVAAIVTPFLESFAFLPMFGAAIATAAVLVRAPKSLREPALGGRERGDGE